MYYCSKLGCPGHIMSDDRCVSFNLLNDKKTYNFTNTLNNSSFTQSTCPLCKGAWGFQDSWNNYSLEICPRCRGTGKI